MKIDPLNINLKGLRFLNDRGISQAVDYGLIKINPGIDFEKDKKRLQPSTLDLKLAQVEDSFELVGSYPVDFSFDQNKTKIVARSKNEILLTEEIKHDRQIPEFNLDFIFPVIDGRSSVRRLGCFVPNHGTMFYAHNDGTTVELNNYSANDIYFDKGERVVQSFFRIDPFKDQILRGMDITIMDLIQVKVPAITSKNLEEIFEKARSLDMGIEITTNEQLEWLQKEGYMKISPNVKFKDGYVLVHASKNASSINKIDGGIIFSKRKEYADKLHKPLNITNSYTIKPFEHIDIETVEQFELSQHVGIQFYNNPADKFLDQVRQNSTSVSIDNLSLTHMIDGWVDPCYEGPFSRQPKWFSKTHVKPGDIIGYGKAIFYPNGVQTGYGDASLGSQYNKAKATAIADMR